MMVAEVIISIILPRPTMRLTVVGDHNLLTKTLNAGMIVMKTTTQASTAIFCTVTEKRGPKRCDLSRRYQIIRQNNEHSIMSQDGQTRGIVICSSENMYIIYERKRPRIMLPTPRFEG